MRKKSGLIILILVMVIQLCVPIGMVAFEVIENNTIIKNGLCVKLELESFSYSNGKLHFDLPSDYEWGTKYAQLVHNGTTGYYEIQSTKGKPEGDFYIKSDDFDYFEFPINSIEVSKYENLDYVHFVKENEDDDWWDKLLHNQFRRAYLEAYVYKGKVIPVAVFIDGVDADTYLERLNEDKQ